MVNTRDAAEIESWVARLDKPGSANYFCVSTLKPGAAARNKDNASELAFLFADIDGKDIADDRAFIERRLAGLKLPPSYVVHSGHGHHVYWMLSEAIDLTVDGARENVEALLRQSADLVGGDLQVCEVARLMRLPGSHNSKFEGEFLPVEVLELNGKRYHLEDLAEMLAETSPIILRKSRPAAKTAGQVFERFLR